MHFTSLALAALPLVAAFADPVVHERARSRSRQHTELTKRQSYSGRATYYAVGLGACGWNNVASDYIVALNTPQYGSGYPGPNCGRSITITANGVSVQATIADQCPSCGYGDLDLSEGLFTRFASTDAGVFQMSWHYNDGNQQPQQQPTTTTQQAQTTPTTTYTPPTSTYTPPTSTYTPPTTTSTQPAETSTVAAVTTTSAPVVSTSASIVASGITTNGTVLPYAVTSEASASASASASSDSTESANIPSSQMGNLAMFNQVVANLGNIVVVGASQ